MKNDVSEIKNRLAQIVEAWQSVKSLHDQIETHENIIGQMRMELNGMKEDLESADYHYRDEVRGLRLLMGFSLSQPILFGYDCKQYVIVAGEYNDTLSITTVPTITVDQYLDEVEKDSEVPF